MPAEQDQGWGFSRVGFGVRCRAETTGGSPRTEFEAHLRRDGCDPGKTRIKFGTLVLAGELPGQRRLPAELESRSVPITLGGPAAGGLAPGPSVSSESEGMART